jgi:hypothetical protein
MTPPIPPVPRKPKGRVPVPIDPEQVERLAPMLNQEQLADYFGIAARTFRLRMEKDKALAAAYKKGRARAIAGAAGSLLQLVRAGNLGAICFFLKTQGGWREAKATQDIRIGNMDTLSDAQLEAIASGTLPET